MEHTPRSARRCRSAFPAGCTSTSSTSLTWRPAERAINGELNIALDKTDFLVVFPLKGEGRARLIGTVREESEHQRDELSWNDVSRRVLEWMPINVKRVNWFSTYRVHHRVAGQFRVGRAFLLGDAAHIHSPVGGQGMNTGIGDAVNLAWKLAAVLRGQAEASLLDSYEQERIAFARRLVATTDRAFTAVTSSSALARLIRLHIVPLLLAPIYRSTAARRLMFRTVSQTAVNYRESSLSKGHAGAVHGGDRLPWVKSALNGSDNFAVLSSLAWQVHIYGEANAEIQRLCDERGLPLHVFPWRPEVGRTGLQRNAVYLLRPDGYVALADTQGRAAAIRPTWRHASSHRINESSGQNTLFRSPGNRFHPANPKDPGNATGQCDRRRDQKRCAKIPRPVHDKPGQRRGNHTREIRKATLKASPRTRCFRPARIWQNA